jgi:glycosyltransferase involved in cell wall biosynthesis
MYNPFVSIIVRTKNEDFWIGKCLNEIFNQKYKNFEVILVDNNSKDKTISIVKKNFPKVKIINYKSKIFLPGKALNLGIKKSKGSLVAMISGHCIPKNENWLNNLVQNFKNSDVIACYGRQEPSDISEPNDVRDLTYLFGLDKKIQIKDPFFHNANSMIRKSTWKKNQFDETIKHIEDRLWASLVLKNGKKIIYEPNSSVIHFHGVGHHGNLKRVSTISKILKKSKSKNKRKLIVCIIPLNKPIKLNGKYLVEKIINDINKIKEISKIFISTTDKKLEKSIIGKKIIILQRDKDLQKKFLGLEYVLSKTYSRYIKKLNPSHIMVAEEIYLNRPKNFFQSIINNFDDNYESIVPIFKNNSNNIWKKDDSGAMQPLFKTSLPSEFVDHKIYEEAKGLGTLVKAEIFENSGRESNSQKFIEIDKKNTITTKEVVNISFD